MKGNTTAKPERKRKNTNGKNGSEKSIIEQIDYIASEWKIERIKNIQQKENQIAGITAYLQLIRSDAGKIDEYRTLTDTKQLLEQQLSDLVNNVEGKALDNHKKRVEDLTNLVQSTITQHNTATQKKPKLEKGVKSEGKREVKAEKHKEGDKNKESEKNSDLMQLEKDKPWELILVQQQSSASNMEIDDQVPLKSIAQTCFIFDESWLNDNEQQITDHPIKKEPGLELNECLDSRVKLEFQNNEVNLLKTEPKNLKIESRTTRKKSEQVTEPKLGTRSSKRKLAEIEVKPEKIEPKLDQVDPEDRQRYIDRILHLVPLPSLKKVKLNQPDKTNAIGASRLKNEENTLLETSLRTDENRPSVLVNKIVDHQALITTFVKNDICECCKKMLSKNDEEGTVSCTSCAYSDVSRDVPVEAVSADLSDLGRETQFEKQFIPFKRVEYVIIEPVIPVLRRYFQQRNSGEKLASLQCIIDGLKSNGLYEQFGHVSVQITAYFNGQPTPVMQDDEKSFLKAMFTRVRRTFEEFRGNRKHFLSYPRTFLRLCRIASFKFPQFNRFLPWIKRTAKQDEAVNSDETFLWEEIIKSLGWTDAPDFNQLEAADREQDDGDL